MTARTQSEWLDWYAEHGGSRELELQPDEQILFHLEHGFVSYIPLSEDEIYMKNMCGDGRYWIKTLIEMMRKAGVKRIKYFTKRNPKIWERLCEAHILGTEMEVDLDVRQ